MAAETKGEAKDINKDKDAPVAGLDDSPAEEEDIKLVWSSSIYYAIIIITLLYALLSYPSTIYVGDDANGGHQIGE